jgi:tRNA nucleotidyltransferase (CCA-adding enzyme)
MKKYLVGGALRDKLLGREVHDRDFVIIGGSENEFQKKYAGAKRIGKKDFVYIYKGDEYTVSNLPDIHKDLLRRDLTINAFAQDEADGSLVSHPDAFGDLEKKILKPVSEENFLRDPLRVFRAARFAAEFPSFQIHSELIRVMTQVSGEGLLDDISAERVGNEVIKACSAPSPGRFLLLLSETGALTPWFHEFRGTEKMPAGPAPYHKESVLEHTAEVMDRLAGASLRVWMGLCHDIGKALSAEELLPSHHGHGERGKVPAKNIGARLKLPNAFINAGFISAEKHMIAARYNELRPGTKVRLLLMLKRFGITKEMFEVVDADKGKKFLEKAEEDTRQILSVHLPEEFKGLGSESGKKLFQLQCQKIK